MVTLNLKGPGVRSKDRTPFFIVNLDSGKGVRICRSTRDRWWEPNWAFEALEPPSSYQLQDKHDESDYEQYMYQPAYLCSSKAESEGPQYEEDYYYRPKHISVLLL